MNKLSEEKIEQYRDSLNEHYWEITEAAWRLSGCSEFCSFYGLDLEMQKILENKKNKIGTIPTECQFNMQGPIYELYRTNLTKLFEIIINFNEYYASGDFSPKIMRVPVKNLIYDFADYPFFEREAAFVCPDEILALAVMEGIFLPQELQIASNIYQSTSHSQSLTQPRIKNLKRFVVAQVLWYKFPGESVNGICAKMATLGKKFKNTRFNFFREFDENRDNLEFKRERDDVRLVRPSSVSQFSLIPNVLTRQNGVTKYDFRCFKIIIRTLAEFLVIGNMIKSESEFFSHPLVGLYVVPGNTAIEKIMKFCLADLNHQIEYQRVNSFIYGEIF